MKEEKPSIKLVFEFEGKEYPIIEMNAVCGPFWDEDTPEPYWNWFWWLDGNGGCDCNRSIKIREYYPDFPEMKCGHLIDLVDYDVIEESVKIL